MPIPWITILTTLLTFFGSKKAGASNTQAAIAAGLVGAGTYYVTHETDWGKAALGKFDGVPTTGETAIQTSAGPAVDGAGVQVKASETGSGFTGVLKEWGATGTAAVLGTAGAVTGSGVFNSKNLPWLIGGVVAVMLIK